MDTIQLSNRFALFHSRFLVHACFWLAYYVIFSVIWASPERGYFASFYLEFVLMPLRILASYCMMYVLIPAFLSNRKLNAFLISYAALILAAGGLQLLIGHFFYDQLLDSRGERFPFSLASWTRNMVLINSTVILLGAAKVFQLHFELVDSLSGHKDEPSEQEVVPNDPVIEVKSNRRIYRLRIASILYVEGMGNYVRYVNEEGDRTIVYSSLKATQAALPDSFVRIHRSYLVNRRHILAYDKDSVSVGAQTLPRGKDTTDEMLKGNDSSRLEKQTLATPDSH
ncbi:MAG: LytTR family transcriptional regulator DNA-binding domain-containing protein [Pseudomonadota bacterium]